MSSRIVIDYKVCEWTIIQNGWTLGVAVFWLTSKKRFLEHKIRPKFTKKNVNFTRLEFLLAGGFATSMLD
jgi:hypothetical protein